MTPAELTCLLAQPGIEKHPDGSLSGDCLCGGRIHVQSVNEQGIFRAVERHQGSLLHMKARKRWTLWSDEGLRAPVETVR